MIYYIKMLKDNQMHNKIKFKAMSCIPTFYNSKFGFWVQ